MPHAYPPPRTLVAPMLDWTDRHFRYMARLITRHTWLYTEMITTGALIHGDRERFLRYDESEHPLVLQLGGSEPEDLALCARLAAQAGYDEVNLNCGCPSERVQKGAFGACLMREADLVSGCLKAMQDAAGIAVSVKHRIGIDQEESYAFVRDFVGTVAQRSGCRIFVVHARNAWLKGLSPKQNREIPPLRYEFVYQLKHDFPELTILINGGIKTDAEIAAHLEHTDGVMIGREAYHNPLIMSTWDQRFYGATAEPVSVDAVVQQLNAYANRELAAGRGTQLRHLCRHFLGLRNGHPGARQWRRSLSDAALLAQNRPDFLLQTWESLDRHPESPGMPTENRVD